MTMVFCALLLLGQAESHIAKAFEPKLSPPLKDVKSDKKFFGPPFPADYPEDTRPVVSKGILNKLKSPDQPYPALQSRDDFDRDFVKDENSDKGAWQAQFEYDALRRKLAQEEADVRRAEDRANRDGHDVDGAQSDDDAAGNAIRDAQKSLDDANKNEGDVKTADDFGGPPSHEKLEELKKAVKAAEERLEQQKKAFEECKRQLEAAKKELEDLQAQQKAMEEKLAADTKLWAEQKAVKLNLKKTRKLEASKKVTAAQEKLAAAEKVKAEAEEKLAKEKAEHEKAKKSLAKEKADLDKLQTKLDSASNKLQQLHGYKPAHDVAPSSPLKSGARMTSAAFALFMIFSSLF